MRRASVSTLEPISEKLLQQMGRSRSWDGASTQRGEDEDEVDVEIEDDEEDEYIEPMDRAWDTLDEEEREGAIVLGFTALKWQVPPAAD